MSGTAVSVITPQNAPRDAAGLQKIGIFQLRMLLEKLGGLQDDESKMAFSKLTAAQKIELSQQMLANFDRANGGGQVNGAQQQLPVTGLVPPPGAPPMMAPGGFQQAAPNGYLQQPPQAPPQMLAPPQQVAEVNPQALAAAQQTASAPTSGRQPRNKQTAATGADTDLGANVLGLLNTLAEGLDKSNNGVATALTSITGSLQNVGGALEKLLAQEAHLKSIDQSYAGVYNVLTSFDQRMTTIQSSTNLAIALSLYLAEQVLGAPRDQILQMASGDIASIQALLTSGGKA